MLSKRCPICGSVGFVQKEHVITATTAITQFYCMLCKKAVPESATDTSLTDPPPIEPPDRSRSKAHEFDETGLTDQERRTSNAGTGILDR